MSDIENQDKDYTSIRVTVTTRDDIASFGSKDDNFEDILCRMIQSYKKVKRK